MTYEPISELRRSQLNQEMFKDSTPGNRDAIREALNEIPRHKAWEAHYRAKGCSARKAETVASDKCRKSRTWPPTP